MVKPYFWFVGWAGLTRVNTSFLIGVNTSTGLCGASGKNWSVKDGVLNMTPIISSKHVDLSYTVTVSKVDDNFDTVPGSDQKGIMRVASYKNDSGVWLTGIEVHLFDGTEVYSSPVDDDGGLLGLPAVSGYAKVFGL